MAVTILKLNFRGVYFEVDVNILQRAPESRLANIARGRERVPMDNEGRHFIDRNPLYFHHILNFYNTGRLEFPPSYSWESIKNEVDFWQIDLNPLTKNSILRYEQQREKLQRAEDINNYYEHYDGNVRGSVCKGCADAFRGMYEFFDVPRSSIPSMIYSVLMCVLIPFFSIGFHIFRTIPQFKDYKITVLNENVTLIRDDEYGRELFEDIFWLVEISVIGILLLEMILRFLCWPAKCRFFIDPLNWADALGILPPLFLFIVRLLEIEAISKYTFLMNALPAFVSFRLFRIFRIWRCFSAYRTLFQAIRYSVKDLFLSLVITFILVACYSLAFYAADSQFLSVPHRIWFSIVTLTSVGYGDIYPGGFVSRVIAMFTMMTTIFVIIVPAISLINNYTQASENLKLAAVIRKSRPVSLKEVPVDLMQPGTPMYPVLPADESAPIVQS